MGLFRRVWKAIAGVVAAAMAVWPGAAPAAESAPVHIGMTGEFGLKNSTSAQSIEKGIRIAIDEINARGGVLGGRPLVLVAKDDRSVPARGIENVRELAALPDLVAVFVGRFSPVALELLPVVHEIGLVMFDPWASADGIVDNKRDPNYVFRLSLRDSLAMPAMFGHAAERGFGLVGLMVPNTAWGRSNLLAAERHVAQTGAPRLVGIEWYNWGDRTLVDKYQALRRLGAQAVVFVGNDLEGEALLKEMAVLPPTERLPVISHWGVTGGDFHRRVGEALAKLDFAVVQTCSLLTADPEVTGRFMTGARKLFGIERPEEVEAPVGAAHAYDLTHILARAIALAGSTDRAAVRDALERVTDYRGLVRHFPRPFSPTRHEALAPEDVFMARFRGDGVIVPLVPRRAGR
jgi:branched-chain amino acid transport system substrate-binding protein